MNPIRCSDCTNVWKVIMKKLSTYSFEIGTIRPPSEGGSYSLLIRATRNCPWSRCKFCYGTPYNREKFELRSVEDIKKDIQAAKTISDEIKQMSWHCRMAWRLDYSQMMFWIYSRQSQEAKLSILLQFENLIK